MSDDEDNGESTKTVDTPDTSAEIKPDVTAYEAKITELTNLITEKDSVISSLTGDLTAAKAANYDLLIGTPSDSQTVDPNVDGIDADSTPDIDDLFEKKE